MSNSSVEEALIARLLAPGSVATLVGTRVTPAPLPQGSAYPAVTMSRQGGIRHSTFGGAIGLPGPLFAVDCWGGQTKDAANVLAKAVRLSLDGVKNWTAAGLTVQASYLEGEPVDVYEEDTQIYRVAMDVRVFWNE